MKKEKSKRLYWTEERCLEEAKKYKSRSEFNRQCRSAYVSAKKHGWLENYTWFETKQERLLVWNDTACYKEAKKYKSRSEFYYRNSSAYMSALRHGWLDNYTWFSARKFKWNENACRAEALKYKTLFDFVALSNGAYKSARRNGWLKDYTWLEQKGWSRVAIWTKDACFAEAKKYETSKEFYRNASTVYSIASKNGWLKDYTWLKKEPIGRKVIWGKDVCLKEAKKFKTIKEFRTVSESAYHSAQRNGWLKDYTWLRKTKNIWNEDTCLAEAKKYDSLTKFYSENQEAFKTAITNGWIDSYNWLTTPICVSKTKWNKATCFEEAKKYKSVREFYILSNGAYRCARNNGWLDNYTWLEKSKRGAKVKWNETACFTEAKKFKTYREFMAGNFTVYQIAKKNGWIDNYTWLERKAKSIA